jgi:hypothetical protein
MSCPSRRDGVLGPSPLTFPSLPPSLPPPSLVMAVLPGEMVYLDQALAIASGTELRRWTIK